MAWRWKGRTKGHDLEFHLARTHEGAAQREWTAYLRANPLNGFCGLAGAPQ